MPRSLPCSPRTWSSPSADVRASSARALASLVPFGEAAYEITRDACEDYRKNHSEAEIRGEVHSKAHTRFGLNWKWDGQECVLQSRCTDELGQVQPTRAQLAQHLHEPPDYYKTNGVQGTDNMIEPWRVASDGSVHNAI